MKKFKCYEAKGEKKKNLCLNNAKFHNREKLTH